MAFAFSNDGSRNRGVGGGVQATVSARKLAAALWQLTAMSTNCGGDVRWQFGLSDGLPFEFCLAPPISKSSMEGVTKWDYVYTKTSTDVNHSSIHARLSENQERETISAAPSGQAGSFKEQKCINELKTLEGSWKTRLKNSAKKLDEEAASWMKTEHQHKCASVKELKDDVRRARKNCKKMHCLYTKLLSDVAEVKSSARKFFDNYEKEKQARELLEDLCFEQAKDLEICKAEIRELRIQLAGVQQEVEEDRRTLQMAEVWREERARMKLVDARMILEDKYSEMSSVIADVKAFLRSSNFMEGGNVVSNVKALEQALDSRNVCGSHENLYMLPKSDKEFTNISSEAYDSSEKSVQSNFFIGSEADNAGDHGFQKADSCGISFVASKK